MRRSFKIVYCISVLLMLCPLIVEAAGMPGARSASNNKGDVFLGGNYIEVGISKSGSFGTSSAAPDDFGSHASYNLGLLSDGDGWNVGNAPTTKDFFLPGTPEERWGIAYKIDGVTYQFFGADRMTGGYDDEDSLPDIREDIYYYRTRLQETEAWLDAHDDTDEDYEDYQDAYNYYLGELNESEAYLEEIEAITPIDVINEYIGYITTEIAFMEEWLEENDETNEYYEEYLEYYNYYQGELTYYTNLYEEKQNQEDPGDQPVDDDEDGFHVRDQSDTANDLLKAVVTGVTPENVKLEITYTFGVNDKYYNTEVKVTNLGDKPITDVRFIRSFDPDQDAEIHNEYSTYNKVICNPDSSIEGSDTNFAMVVARGGETLDGFFFVAFDNRARASHGVSFIAENIYEEGYWVESTPGLPTYATEENLAMTKDEINGYTYEDSAVSLTFNLDTINAGGNAEFNFYSSLDPNVITSISSIIQAVSASVKNYTDTRIEVETQEGYEYSIDGGEHWQESGVFEGLEPGKEYTILSRIKATNESEASEPEETTVTTKNSSPTTPDINALSVTEDSITVQTMEGYEYSIDGGQTWQTSPNFTNLEPDTEYVIVARYKETNSTMYGTQTSPITLRTLEKEEGETVLDTLPNVDVTLSLSNDSPVITINKGKLYDAISDDEDIQDAIDNNDNVEIRFVVENVEVEEEETEKILEELSKNEKIGFTVDASIELYINGTYVKDISESAEEITFKITIPSNLRVNGRRFYLVKSHINSETGELEITRVDDTEYDGESLIVKSSEFSNFTVIYDDLLVNPNTSDHVSKDILLFIISMISLIAFSIKFKKRLGIS